MRSEAQPWTIITGAAGGIGLAIVRLLRADRHRILAIDANVEALAAMESVISRTCDVRDHAALAKIVGEAGATAPITALVCCAAVFPAAPVAALDETSWDRVFDVNVGGTLSACQLVTPRMRAAGGGSIVAFSSAMARSGGINAAHYAASKGAVLGLVRSLALDVAADGIRVNSVSPGLTDTAQPRANMTEAELFARGARVPLGRAGTPEDSAEAVRFLLSKDASFVTGQDVRVTGGACLF
jgi:2-hydroxycyclohexanecarboxyl-CoA dehydrogenase